MHPEHSDGTLSPSSFDLHAQTRSPGRFALIGPGRDGDAFLSGRGCHAYSSPDAVGRYGVSTGREPRTRLTRSILLYRQPRRPTHRCDLVARHQNLPSAKGDLTASSLRVDMARPVHTVAHMHEPLAECLRKFRETQLDCLPVTADATSTQVIGVVTPDRPA